MKNKGRLFIIIAAVLVIGVGVYSVRDRVAAVVGGTGGARTQTDAGALVTVPVQRRDIIHTITATGNVLPARQVDLRFSRAGRVQDVRVSAGERVEAGDLLATLDNREPELAYLRARNAYEIARIDSAPNVVREREIDMELAEDALEQTLLRAPFGGVVTEMYVEPGQSIGTGDVVVQLVDDSAFEVRVAVDELDIARVREGQPVTIRLDADPGRQREGIVEQVSLVANMQGSVVTVPVTVRFLEADPFLRPGYTATLQIVVAEARDTLVVPVEAIWEEGSAKTVTQLVDGEMRHVSVTTGLSDGTWVEIRSGLEPGDEVVALNYRGGPAAGSGGRGAGAAAGGGRSTGPTMMRLPVGR